MDTGKDMAIAVDRLGNGGAKPAGDLRTRNSGAAVDGPATDLRAVAVPETGVDGSVAVADGAPSTQKWKPSDNVYLRLARAQDDVKVIKLDADIKGKTKEGAAFAYKGVSAPQVMTFAKTALFTNGVVFLPIAREGSVKVAGNKTAVYVDGHFISVDDPADRFVSGAWGAGTDFNDKDFAKAMTNAVKIILAKTLMMSTLEDESEDAIPHEPEHKPKAVRAAEALTDVAIKSWADGFKSALDGCKNIKQLKHVRADNAPMMNNPGIPQITKEYFLDKIAALEGVLE